VAAASGFVFGMLFVLGVAGCVAAEGAGGVEVAGCVAGDADGRPCVEAAVVAAGSAGRAGGGATCTAATTGGP
jgi:hypothetical protein